MKALRWTCRTLALAIAVAGAVDPAVSHRHTPLLAVGVAVHVEDEGQQAARSALRRLESFVGPDAGVRFSADVTRATALACDRDEPCIVVTDGTSAIDVPRDRQGPTSLVRAAEPAAPNVAVTSVEAMPVQAASASGVVRVTLAGRGVAGRRTEVSVFDGDVLAGEASYDWRADQSVTLEVPWWPVADGPRLLAVSAAPFAGESSDRDNHVDVGVLVTPEATRVLVYAPRPSWSATFVRRALEADARFTVQSVTRLGPSMAAISGPPRLDRRALADAAVAVVGAPDGLDASEVALFERFVRVRGGTLVLLPDRALSGPVTRLLRGRWTERLLRGAERSGPLIASEFLEGDAIGPLDIVLGQRGDRAVITAAPMAAGRVVVSGAMDAWRHRAEGDGAFDRFWVGLVADGGRSGHGVDVDLARTVAAPGARVPVTVRLRSMDRIDAMRITAAIDCGTGAPDPLRLWPAGQPGTLGGTVIVPAQGPCTITASADGGGVGSAGLSVAASPRVAVGRALRDVERAVAATGGVLATFGDEERVAEWVRRLPKPAPTWTRAHPMRSPWWLLPFVAGLGIEWWLRRRRGLK